jgi:hypothetical protein
VVTAFIDTAERIMPAKRRRMESPNRHQEVNDAEFHGPDK